MKSEDPAVYAVRPTANTDDALNVLLAEVDDDIAISKALAILSRRMKPKGAVMGSPDDARSFLSLKLNGLEHEVFACLFLDSQNCFVAYEELFRGTLNQTSVYPREIVKAALKHNAGAVVLAHNHPSGVPEPSSADQSLTSILKTALAMVDVRVLDHIIVAGTNTLSFAERGLI